MSQPLALTEMGHFIDYAEARRLLDNYELKKHELINPSLLREQKEYGILPDCEAFNADGIKAILEQKDCVGIRIHYGLKDEDEKGNKVPLIVAVLVGVAPDGKDLWGQTESAPKVSARSYPLAAPDPGGVILEDSQRSPPYPKP
ncbi:MAG: hypothetical protein EOO02_01200 [Chitinophagaceae bacterium]|nr:MAG: hypothetical protein EOO02_01200 [Chitinophagaceae bacterium]